MLMIQFLKPLCDLSFYFALFGSMLAFGTSMQHSLIPLLILALVQFFCYLTREKSIRYLPLLGLLLLVPYLTGWGDLLLYLLGGYYVMRSCSKSLYNIGPMSFQSNFILQIRIVPFLLFVGIVAGFLDVLERYTIPFLLIYFATSILLMRCLRVDENVLHSKGFMTFNVVSLMSVMGLGFFLSSNQAIGFLKGGISFVYGQIILPILDFILSIFLFILTQLAWLGQFFFTKDVVIKDDGRGEIVAGVEMDYGETIIIDTPMWVKTLFIGLVVAVIFYLAYRLLRHLQEGGVETTKGNYANLEKDRTAPLQQNGFSLFKRKDARDRLREVYKSFMLFYQSKGFTMPVWMDTIQLHRIAGGSPSSKRLRELYLLARYSEHEISKEDLQTAKEQLKKIKEQYKNEEGR